MFTLTGFVRRLERFEGTVRGKRGSFVIQSEGQYQAAVVDSRGHIVGRAGTGDPGKVTREVPYESGQAKEYPLVFRLHLG